MHIYMIGDQYRVDGVSGRFVEEPLDASLPIYEDVLELHTARNQYVSFQIVLDAREEGKIDAVEVSFTDLQGKHGALPADYEPFVEWFHTIGQQHIPDMLLPWGKVLPCRVPLSQEYLPEQRVGAIWVDLFVDKAAKPGRYEGIVSVQADGVRKDLKILLRVHRCVTPTESLMIADLNNYADSISPEYPFLRDNPNRYRDGSYLKVERQFYRMAREHRCLFEHLNAPHCGIPPETFAPELEGAGKYIKVRSWEAFDEHFGPAFMQNRNKAMSILQEENELNEIVQLVGKDSLSAGDQLTLETAKMVREDFLQQNAFMDVDSYSSFDRQMRLLALILDYDKLAREALTKGAALQPMFDIPAKEKIGRAKFVEADQYVQAYADIAAEMKQEIAAIVEKAGADV